MTSKKEIGIEEARGRLGSLVTAAQHGTTVVLTRNGKPAAQITAYQEAPAMLTTHHRQVTNPNQSGMVTTVHLSEDLSSALLARDIDLGQVHVESDDTVTVQVEGGRIAIGQEDGWITALLVADDSEAPIYEGTSLDDLTDAIARAAR